MNVMRACDAVAIAPLKPEATVGLSRLRESLAASALVAAIEAAAPRELELLAAYRWLTEPFLAAFSTEARLDARLVVAGSGSHFGRQAERIVDYNYSCRFGAPGRLMRFDESETEAITFAVVADDPRPVVLATMRATWGGSVDVVRLFDIAHDASDGAIVPKVGSLGRFALNPAFDALLAARSGLDLATFRAVNAYRSVLFRQLTALAIDELDRQGVDAIYTISPAALAVWFASAGVRSTRVESARMADSEEVHRLQRLYPKYWHAEPSVFRIDGVVGESSPDGVMST